MPADSGGADIFVLLPFGDASPRNVDVDSKPLKPRDVDETKDGDEWIAIAASDELESPVSSPNAAISA